MPCVQCVGVVCKLDCVLLSCPAVFWKMHLMLGQLEEQEGRTEAARSVYASGLKRCADCVPLWRSAARLEEKAGNVGRARALLEQVC